MDEFADFLSNLRTTMEIFVNRMKSNSSRGRPIANDTHVQSLFMNITNMHSQLLKYLQEQDDLRGMFFFCFAFHLYLRRQYQWLQSKKLVAKTKLY